MFFFDIAHPAQVFNGFTPEVFGTESNIINHDMIEKWTGIYLEKTSARLFAGVTDFESKKLFGEEPFFRPDSKLTKDNKDLIKKIHNDLKTDIISEVTRYFEEKYPQNETNKCLVM